MSETVYARAHDVVWRLGPDRVLIRRVGAGGENSAVDLLGAAALVWIALDEPCTIQQIDARLAGTGRNQGVDGVVVQLLEGSWLELATRNARRCVSKRPQ